MNALRNGIKWEYIGTYWPSLSPVYNKWRHSFDFQQFSYFLKSNQIIYEFYCSTFPKYLFVWTTCFITIIKTTFNSVFNKLGKKFCVVSTAVREIAGCTRTNVKQFYYNKIVVTVVKWLIGYKKNKLYTKKTLVIGVV